MLLVIAVMVVLALGLVWILHKRSSERKRIASLSPAEREAHDASREYEQRVAAAEREHKRESKAIELSLKNAAQEMKQAEAAGRRLIGTCRGKDGHVSLFEHQIVVDGQTFPLDQHIKATVDTAGALARTKRATLTRMAAGGILLGGVGILAGGMVQKKKTNDDRELYLMVEGASFAALITCDPSRGQMVRQFAAKVNNAGKTVSEMNELHDRSVEAAKVQLLEVTAAAKESETSNDLKLESVRNDNKAVEAAKARLLALGELPELP